MKEIWKDIKGYKGYYQVSNLGRVKSFKQSRNGKILSQHTGGKDDYLFVGLYNNERKPHRTARLVAVNFIDNPNNYPQVNHIDGDKQNNNIHNLEWCTGEQNMRHASGMGLLSSGYKLNELQVRIIRRARSYFKGIELAEIFNITPSMVSDIVKHRTWKHI